MKWFYLTALAAVAFLAAAPCWLLPRSDAHPYKGLVVRYDLYPTPVKTLDPADCADTTSAGFQANVFEGPYAYHYLKRPVESAVIPQLAAALPEISPVGRTYTIRLKSGILFHRNPCFGLDPAGRPNTRAVTAADFILAFQRIADSHVEASLAYGFLSRIEGIEDYREKTRKYSAGDFRRYDELAIAGLTAPDPLTLRIRLAEPFPQLTYALASHMFAPIPREAVDYHLASQPGRDGRRDNTPADKRRVTFRQAHECVGTGPYLWDTFKEKHEIVFRRNPDFRDERYPSEGEPGDREAGLLDDAGKPVPFIDVLHYDFAAETSSFWKLFLARQTDIASVPAEEFDKIITPGADLREKWARRGIRLHRFSVPAVYFLAFNMKDPVVGASPSLRRALCSSFDGDAYVKVVVRDRGVHAVSLLPHDFAGWKEAGPGPYFTYDLSRAKALAAQARKELAARRLLDKDGQIPPITLDLGGQDEFYKSEAEFLRRQFERIGVTLKTEFNDWQTLQGKVNNKQTQIYSMGWHADYPDAENFLQLFWTPNIDRQINNTNYSNAAFDRLYEQARVMPAGPQRTELYAQMTRLIADDCPILPLTEPVYFLLAYDYVRNLKPHPIGVGFLRFTRIDTRRRHALGGRED